MKIYISGKIKGEVKHKFEEVEKALREAGHTPINPLVLSPWNLRRERFMRISCIIIGDDSVDAVYMLDNWMDSPGAKEEHRFAKAIGKDILYQNSCDPEKAEQ